MIIYTKKGDFGFTSLINNKKVAKTNVKIEVLGNIDELDSFLGLLITKIKNKKDRVFLVSIQKDLYKIMSYFSGAKISLGFIEKRVLLFEKKIDSLKKKMFLVANRFVFFSENEVSSWFNILRTICRRTERSVCRFLIKDRYLIIKYFNRLSDLLFVLAFSYNKKNSFKSL